MASGSFIALNLPIFLLVFGSCFNQPLLNNLVLCWSIEFHVVQSVLLKCVPHDTLQNLAGNIFSESSKPRYKLQSLHSTLQACFLIFFIVIGLILFPLENLDPAARYACEVDLFCSLHLCCVLRTLFFRH